MRPLRAIVVEDEPAVLRGLVYKIEHHCPEIEIVEQCKSGRKAIEKIKQCRPDVVFLDIQLGDMTGFDVLAGVPFTRFEVIFVTHFNEYAIQAIREQALDFLLKPVDTDEWEQAVARLVAKHQQAQPRTDRIGLPIATGEKYVRLSHLLYLEAQNNRCQAHLLINQGTESPLALSRPLAHMEHQLSRFGFARPNQAFLVNLEHINEFQRNDGGWLIMSDGKPIRITHSFRDRFHQFRRDWEIPQ